jgi:hypothetical protein
MTVDFKKRAFMRIPLNSPGPRNDEKNFGAAAESIPIFILSDKASK